jgi:hypothetical protein
MNGIPTPRDDIYRFAELIRKDANYSNTAFVKNRAERCVSQLTSEEREHFLQILSTAPPEENKTLEKNILNKIKKIEWIATSGAGYTIADTRDESKNFLQRAIANISRATQNTFGFRKGTKDVITELDSLAKMKSIKNESHEFRQGLFFHSELFTDDKLFNDLLEKSLKTLNANRAVDCKNEYKLLGLKPGASQRDLDKALVEYLNKNKDRELGIKTYRKIMLFKDAKDTFQKNSSTSISLKEAYQRDQDEKINPEAFKRAMTSLMLLSESLDQIGKKNLTKI